MKYLYGDLFWGEYQNLERKYIAHYIDKFMIYIIPVSYYRKAYPNDFDMSDACNNIQYVVTYITMLFYFHRCTIFISNRLA